MLRRRVIGSINISNVAIVTCESKTYNGQTQVATNITVAFKGETLTENVDYIITENNGGTNVDSYTVKIKGVKKYSGEAQGQFSITKAAGSVTIAPVNNNYTYNGTARAVASAGSGTGTMYYRLGTSGSFSTTIPSMTNAGSDTLYYYAAASTNYEQSSTGSIAVSVQKANISPTVSISNWTYGNSPSDPSVTGNSGGGTVTYYYKSTSSSSWSTTKPSNAGNYNIRADIAETTNYNSGTCSNNFTINKANSSLSFSVTNITVEKGQTKTNAVTVNAGDGVVTYTSNDTSVVTVNNSGVVTGVGVGNTTVTANISSSSNYNSASTSYTANCAITVITKFNVNSTSSPTRIASGTTSFTSIEIDGVTVSPRTGYTFSTTGEHTVKYYLTNTSIGQGAFRNCSGMTSCIISDDVTSIGNSAFTYCSGLTSITVEATTPPTLGGDAFTNTNNCPIYVPYCSLVDTYRAASGWSSYSSRIAAHDCPTLTTKFNVTSTTSPTLIGYFGNISGFSEIEIDGVVQPNVVSAYTFSTTGEHTVKYILNSTSISNSSFYNCSAMTSCNIGNGVTNIGDYTFGHCTSLTSIAIPNSVTSIGNSAFSSCKSLTSIDIPSGVTSIGYSAFWGCTSLTSITVDSNNSYYDSRNNCNAIIETSTNTLLKGCENTIIPNTVTSIGGSAFEGCYGLTSIDIPNSVTSIGDSAFEGCYGLTTCAIGNSVTSIGGSAFQGCSGLTSIDIPDSVTSIGDSAFTQCYSLTACTFGGGLTNIGHDAFQKCSGLTSIVLQDNVKDISYRAFSSCSGLTSVTIGSGVTSIGYACFSGARYATFIINATTPPALGANAIDTSNSRPIYVPSCALVDTYRNTSGWSSYYSRISSTEACGCITAKFNVTSTSSPTMIANVITDFISIEIDGVTQPSVTTSYTFSTTGEHTVKYYLNKTNIGGDTFLTCSGMTSCTIGSGVTSIGSTAFNNCTSLTSIEIPNSVTSINHYAFTYCNSLTSIVCNATTAPTIANDTFQRVKTGGTLYVPIGSTGYDVWMGTGDYYLGKYNWTKVEQ